MDRYTVREIPGSGSCVFDNVKGQLVWANMSEGKAEDMAASLNEIHDASPAPAGVPREVLNRVVGRIMALEEAASRKDVEVVRLQNMEDIMGAQVMEETVASIRRQAADLKCLLSALGLLTGE